ncbi:hypothetical protein Q2295_00755, partial [Leptospira interrogans]|uniref:hypothetical protein n=1 Tax=Leptospira interrogans TaxID=173 RepID=UPI0035621FFC
GRIRRFAVSHRVRLSSTSSFSHAHLPGSRRVFSLFTKAQNALARKLRILLARFLFCCMIKL